GLVGQHGGVFGRKPESTCGGVIGQIARAGHRPEPFPCVAFLNPSPPRQFLAGSWSLRMKVPKKPQLVADGTEHGRRERAGIVEHPVHELLHLLLVDWFRCHAGLLDLVWAPSVADGWRESS